MTLTIDPPPTLSLEDMLAKIDSDIVPSLRAQLPPDANIRLAGSADRLDTIVSTMGDELPAGAAGAVHADGGDVPLAARRRWSSC